MIYTEAQIFEGVQAAIAEALRISPQEVNLDSVLGDDLRG